MTGAGSIAHWAGVVLVNLRDAADGPEPLLPAVFALRQLLLAQDLPGPETASAADVAALQEALSAAAFRLASSAPEADADAIAIGFGSADGLVRALAISPERRAEFEAPGDLDDRIDRVALAADLLDADLRRRRITARGDLFARLLAARRAFLDGPAPDAALH